MSIFSKNRLMPYINKVTEAFIARSNISYQEASGVYTIKADSDSFRILQLTDIHLGGTFLSYSRDKKALIACDKLIKHAKPDLVVVTGDLTYPMRGPVFSYDNKRLVRTFAAFMRRTGVPWAITFGNHDSEVKAVLNGKELNRLFVAISKKDAGLLYPLKQPKITGRNNQMIEIRNTDGSIRQALFLLDTHAYTDEVSRKYDHIHDDQVNWYRDTVLQLNKESGETVSSLIFIHIPIQQYKTAYELYQAEKPEVKYFFGVNKEKGYGKVCCSDTPSTLFDTAKELGSTKGFFCGHDHYNNMSLEYEGIRLTYGMSIDYLVMRGIAHKEEQRGGTIIDCRRDGTVEIEQLPLTDI
ncbi:MAG: metallophosphoesterase [Eubacterium sp.]|nr:metallophosphoesterase [Eubacterium sp.]